MKAKWSGAAALIGRRPYGLGQGGRRIVDAMGQGTEAACVDL